MSLRLPRGQFGKLVPGLQGQLHEGVTGTWEAAMTGLQSRLPLGLQQCPLLRMQRNCAGGMSDQLLSPAPHCLPLVSRGFRLDALSSSTCSFCSEAR